MLQNNKKRISISKLHRSNYHTRAVQPRRCSCCGIVRELHVKINNMNHRVSKKKHQVYRHTPSRISSFTPNNSALKSEKKLNPCDLYTSATFDFAQAQLRTPIGIFRKITSCPRNAGDIQMVQF